MTNLFYLIIIVLTACFTIVWTRDSMSGLSSGPSFPTLPSDTSDSMSGLSSGPSFPTLPSPSFETDVSFFGSGTTFGEYYELELAGFQQLYRQFNTDCVPFFAIIVTDIRTKIGEFQKMNGAQEFLSLGSLYSQYIPLNAIVNQHILLQAKQLKETRTSSFKEQETSYHNPIIKFTVPDYNLLQNAYAAFSKGNKGIIQSVVRTVNALQAAANSSTLNVTGDTLQMSRNLAQGIYQSLKDFSNSVHDIYVGSKSFATKFNVTKVQKYQDNPDSSDFINDLYNFLAGASHVNKAYATAARNQANIFYTPNGSAGNTFSTNITNMNNIINAESLKIAGVFGSTDSIDDTQQNEIKQLSK